jgi:uncharacterized protein (TIGR02118 family)
MYKLVILIEPPEDRQTFDAEWPEFLHLAEQMPGLRQEATCRVEQFLFGACPYAQVHELYFDTLPAAQQAMASEPGRSAGRLLQQITGGKVTLFIADHKQDDLENIRKFK